MKQTLHVGASTGVPKEPYFFGDLYCIGDSTGVLVVANCAYYVLLAVCGDYGVCAA